MKKKTKKQLVGVWSQTESFWTTACQSLYVRLIPPPHKSLLIFVLFFKTRTWWTCDLSLEGSGSGSVEVRLKVWGVFSFRDTRTLVDDDDDDEGTTVWGRRPLVALTTAATGGSVEDPQAQNTLN